MPSLWNETGHASQDERNTEAMRYIEELLPHLEKMDPRYRQFVNDLNVKVQNNNLYCSGKQLYWLRDLYSKYVLEE